jgi:hypothetical protein
MATDSYWDRIKQAKQSVHDRLEAELPKAKELLERSASASVSIGAKATSAISSGYSSAASKVRDIVESDEAKIVASKIQDAGQSANRLLTETSTKTINYLRRTDAKPHPFADKPEDERDTHLAIAKLRSKDKVGLAGEHLSAIGGGAAGIAAAGTIAGTVGATTLLGSGTLAGVFGGVFLTATPVGWVIGSAVLAAAAGYGIAKMIRSGSEQDQVRKEVIQRLTNRLSALKTEKVAPDCKAELNQLLELTVAAEAISEEAASRMVALIESGALNPDLALARIKSIALARGVIELAENT